MRKRTNEPLRANVKRTMKKKEIKELANKKIIMKLYHHGPCACEQDFYLSRVRYFPSHRRSRQAAVPHPFCSFFLYWPNYLGPLEEVASRSSFPFVFSAVSLASPPGSFLGFHEAICWFGSLLHVALMLFVDCFWSPSKVRFISSECARFVSCRFVSFHFMSPFSPVRQFWSDWLARLVTR